MLLTEIKSVKDSRILTRDISFGQQLKEEFYKKASKDDIWKMERAIRMADLNEFNYLIKRVLGIEPNSIESKDSTKKDYDIILRNLNEQLSNAIVKEDLEKVNELISKIDKIKKLWESTSDSELNDISLFDFGIENDIYTKDPLTEKGKEIMKAMKEQYGEEVGEKIFYASKNKGTIEGVDVKDGSGSILYQRLMDKVKEGYMEVLYWSGDPSSGTMKAEVIYNGNGKLRKTIEVTNVPKDMKK